MAAVVLALIIAFWRPAGGWPVRATCRAWSPGDPGYMASGPLADGSAGAGAEASCALIVDGDPTEFESGVTYNVTVSATVPSLFMLHSSDGQCFKSQATSPAAKAVSETFSWTAPQLSEEVLFKAVCGSGFTQKIYVAATKRLLPKSVLPDSNCSLANEVECGSYCCCEVGYLYSIATKICERETPSPSEGAEPSAPREEKVGSATDLPLAPDGPNLAFRPIGEDSVEFTVRLQKRAWLGFGFPSGDGMRMGGSGSGSDIFVCTDGEVRRYWVTGYEMPQEYLRVAESVCTQAGASTSMTFVRAVAAAGTTQRSLTPGTVQPVIFAHGNDGVTSLQYHGVNSGGIAIDFNTSAFEDPPKRRGEASLYLHLGLMTFAWGGCLPFGVAVASRTRSVPGAPTGAWFKLHMRIMMFGWLLQVLGLGAAIWFCQEFSTHFASGHACVGIVVVAIGTLQPLNAAIRPHPKDPKTWARLAFEVVHKGLGWLAVLLGMANVVVGIVLVNSRSYDAGVLGTSIALATLCMLLVVAFFILATCFPGNVLSRWLTGAHGYDGTDAEKGADVLDRRIEPTRHGTSVELCQRGA